MTKTTSKEFATHNIIVNAISPRMINAAMFSYICEANQTELINNKITEFQSAISKLYWLFCLLQKREYHSLLKSSFETLTLSYPN